VDKAKPQLMKLTFTLIALLLLNCSFAQNQILFAKIKDDGFKITADTVKLKKRVIELLFKEEQRAPNFSISVEKRNTVGEVSDEYYCVILTDSEHNITVAKWLEKRKNKLYITDQLVSENYLQVYYTACIGQENCSPQIVVADSKKYWACAQASNDLAASQCTKSIGVIIK
jgi:hypothetical protein